MWINGIEYELVEKGTTSTMFLFGLFIGMLFIGMILMFYFIGRRNMFRKYYHQIIDEANRKKTIEQVEKVADEIDELAEETNTLFFKKMANEFNLLIADVRKRD